MAALVLAGCAPADVDGEADERPTEPAPSTSTAPEGFPVVAADAVQEQRWRLPGGHDWLPVTDAGVWVEHDDGTVSRIAPDTGEIDLTVEVDRDHCQGLGPASGRQHARGRRPLVG